MVIFRAGLPITVPARYWTDPAHLELVSFLNQATSYASVVAFLDNHVISWLAADILRGVPWSARFLNTTARLSHSKWPAERRLARAGQRALMALLAGVPRRTGRGRATPLTPEQMALATAAIARWRARVDEVWPDRAALQSIVPAMPVARYRQARSMLQRPRLRKAMFVLFLASVDAGVPARRLRQAHDAADLVYG